MEKYITSLKMGCYHFDWYQLKNHFDWYQLKNLPVLTVEQIKDCDNDCIRMYLYCYYNYSEFYKYKKKKLLNRYITEDKSNLLLFSAWCGNLNALKYLVSCGLNINYKNIIGHNAYIYACGDNNIEVIKYLETTNINIYQRDRYLNNACGYAFEFSPPIYDYFTNKFLYSGYSKICSICYSNTIGRFITCSNNHVVHLCCQQHKNTDRCLNCSFKYLI